MRRTARVTTSGRDLTCPQRRRNRSLDDAELFDESRESIRVDEPERVSTEHAKTTLPVDNSNRARRMLHMRLVKATGRTAGSVVGQDSKKNARP